MVTHADYIPYEPELRWMVYYHNINKDKIVPWNIFEHWSFRREVLDLLKQECKRDGFAVEVQRSLRYYFWSKSEYEVVIKQWVGKEAETKIDVCDQVLLNFEPFVDYLWRQRAALGFRDPERDVIHCKDCKYFGVVDEEDGGSVMGCRSTFGMCGAEADDFCSFAREKESEERT